MKPPRLFAETLLRIGGGKCDDAAEGRRRAMLQVLTWLNAQCFQLFGKVES